MMELIGTYGYHYLVVHFVLAVLALNVDLLNSRVLYVRNFVWAFVFGPLYLIGSINDMDKIIIDLRSKDKK